MIITILVVFLIIGVVVNVLKLSKEPPKYDKPLKKFVYYIGGCKEIYDAGHMIMLIINEDKIELKTEGLDCKIPIDNILEAYLQTEEEIKKDVTLGRLILVGILAFGLKKTSKEIKKYVVIKFLNKKGEEDTVILESKGIKEILETINNFKNKYDEVIKNRMNEQQKGMVK